MNEIVIRFATSTQILDRLFRARHHVFADVDGCLPVRSDKRLCDRFDAYPTSRNVIAEHDGRITALRLAFSTAEILRQLATAPAEAASSPGLRGKPY